MPRKKKERQKERKKERRKKRSHDQPRPGPTSKKERSLVLRPIFCLTPTAACIAMQKAIEQVQRSTWAGCPDSGQSLAHEAQLKRIFFFVIGLFPRHTVRLILSG